MKPVLGNGRLRVAAPTVSWNPSAPEDGVGIDRHAEDDTGVAEKALLDLAGATLLVEVGGRGAAGAIATRPCDPGMPDLPRRVQQPRQPTRRENPNQPAGVLAYSYEVRRSAQTTSSSASSRGPKMSGVPLSGWGSPQPAA
jgi:hypothetical protein